LIHESIATHVITESGIGLYCTTNPRVKNQYFNLPPAKEYELRKKEAKAKGYLVQWTNPHKNDDIEGLMVTANAPIVDDTGNFLGMAGIDIPITSIVPDLTWKEAKENRDPGAILFSFIMDKNGNLIVFPESCFDLFSLGTDPGEFKYSRDILDKNLVNSQNPAIKKAVKQILDSPGSLLSIKLNGDTYILATSRLSETGWHLVLVSREKDLLSSVHETRNEMEKSLAQVSGYYLKYCALIIALAILFIFLAVKIIILPIKQLTALTLKVSEGDLSMGSQVSSKNEIGELAAALSQMIEKISLSEKSKATHARALENRIDQLKGLNEHLVFSEEMERKSIAADLHDSLAQTLAIGISKIKNITEPDTPINPEDLLEIQGVLEQAIIEIRSLI
ncbi:MAG: HAMP domain-containing protein, partial [Desulfobacteraceae bacterium]|nr:HAMP domain-containing protein [Desulfobacteraceae bacterium]